MRLAQLTLLLLPLLTACDPTLGGSSLPVLGGSDHPCTGSKTDTVWLDDDETVWVGCGSNGDGTGLYRGEGLGGSWASVSSFESFRVSHVHRGPDDKLYVAGTDTNSSDRVKAIVSETELETVFESQSQTWNSFHVGSFVRTDDGLSVAESLTGYDAAFRDDDEAEWQDGYGWWGAGDSVQILDMVNHRGEIVGVGSTITQPPFVYTQDEGSGFAMTPIEIDSYSGELWSVDTDTVGLIAGGVDQDAANGMVFWNDGDPSNAADWQSHRITDESPTWVRGVCRDNDILVAAVEYTVTSNGMLLVSTDGGATWADETPAGAPALTQCMVIGNTLVVAGAEGFFAALEVG